MLHFPPYVRHLVTQIYQFPPWQAQQIGHVGVRGNGQLDSRIPKSFRPALYSKKPLSFTAFFSFSTSHSGRPVKNSSGSPVAMLARMQANR